MRLLLPVLSKGYATFSTRLYDLSAADSWRLDWFMQHVCGASPNRMDYKKYMLDTTPRVVLI